MWQKKFSIDFSVLEISGEYDENVFKLSMTPADIFDQINVWMIDHTGLDDTLRPNLYHSRITEFRCRVQNQAEKASLMLEKCPVIQGNSGSPALNLAGDVIGVVWGATALDIDNSLSFSVRRSLDEFAAVTEMFHFSSYAL